MSIDENLLNVSTDNSYTNEELSSYDYNTIRAAARSKIANNSNVNRLIKIIREKGVLNVTSILEFLEYSIIDKNMMMIFRNNKEYSDEKIINDTCDVFENLINKHIPEKYSKSILSSMALRSSIIPLQGYAIVSKDWIRPFAKWIGKRKCLEIMAGKGTLSYALKNEGISIIPTDNFSWNTFNFNDLWTTVENIDSLDAIEKYGRDVDIIIMSWCYMDQTGYKSLIKMREVNPNLIMIYIGESRGGCTGSDSLFNEMIEINNIEIDKINDIFPNFFGIHDRIHLIK